MPSVTVAGAHGLTTTLAFDTSANANLAAQYAAMISAAVQAGSERAADSAYGPPPPLGGLPGLFTQSTPGLTALPHGYADVVVSAANAVILGSGDANEHILVGSGNVTFDARGGSGAVVTGGGNDTVVIPATDSGNWLVQTGGGNDTIVDLAGADTISPGLGDNAVTLGGGTYDVTSVGQDSITAGAGNATVDASGSAAGTSELVFAGSGSLTFIGGGGAATIIGGTGSETVTGGSGSLYAQGGTAGFNLLTAGIGQATLLGGAGGDTLTAAGNAPQELYGGAGNETLSGGTATGADTFFAGPGQDQITGGLGADTYVGGAGQATVNAVGSSNVFDFIHGAAGGTVLVNDLTNAAQVNINLTGYGPTEAANALAGQTTDGTSVTLTLSDHTQITFENITHLTNSNFS
jgi:Ca2+-binding RTX toxin-like protein